MEPLLTCFTIAALSCCWADIPARKPPSIAAPKATSSFKQEVEADRYFRRGVQFADGEEVPKDMSKLAEHYLTEAEPPLCLMSRLLHLIHVAETPKPWMGRLTTVAWADLRLRLVPMRGTATIDQTRVNS